MPNVQFVCPQCEKQSEVQVASVTRSRACPHCGFMVLLQVAGKATKTTRRALLVTASKSEALPVGRETHLPGTPAYLPMPLEGDVFDRMRGDPEILTIRKQLISGLGVLGLTIVAVIVWHLMPASKETEVKASSAPKVVALPAPQPSKSLQSNTIAVRASNGGAAGGLTFVAADGKIHTPPGIPAPVALPEKVEQARRVLAAFLAADTVETLLATVADRASIEVRLRDYYQKHPLVPLRAMEITPMESPPSGGTGTVALEVTLSSGRRLQATVLVMDARHMGVDWPGFVALSDMEWSEFISSKPTSATLFRLLVEQGDWFANDFADSTKLGCLKLTSPNDPMGEPVFAYVERNSPLGHEIDSMLNTHAGPVPLTLRLRFPSVSQADNQCWLDSVVSNGWLILPETRTAQISH